jgi:hypothetical protein
VKIEELLAPRKILIVLNDAVKEILSEVRRAQSGVLLRDAS